MRRCLVLSLCFVLLVVVACNLQPITAPTPTPFPTPFPVNAAGTQVIYVTATPFALPPGGNVTIGVNDPNTGIPAQSNDVANWIINNVVAPAWNFAGNQAGVMGQIVFCVFPLFIAMLMVGRYFFSGRRR